MARLILLALVTFGVIVAITSVMSAVKHSAADPSKEGAMPKSFRTVSYVLLVLLMLGITTGLIGGL